MTSGAGASFPRESPLRSRSRRFCARDAWKEGRLFFEEQTARRPGEAESHAHLGFFCVKESRYDTTRGLAELEAARRIEPGCAIAHVYSAIVLGYLLRQAPARAALEAAAGRGASAHDLAWAGGCVELDAGSVSEAIRHFTRLCELLGDSTSLILLSQAYSQAGRNEDAAACAERARAADPQDFRAPLYAGIYLAYLGRLAAAREKLEASRALKPDFALLRHSLAYVARKEGRAAEEEEHLRAALAVDPDYATSLKALADVCAASGRPDEARRLYGAALERFPDYREARDGLTRLTR